MWLPQKLFGNMCLNITYTTSVDAEDNIQELFVLGVEAIPD